MRFLQEDSDLQSKNEKLLGVMKNIANIINEPAYEIDNDENNGLLNCSSGQITDFKVTLASAIVPYYRYKIC